ncbi:MAG TPA: glycosyltransferase [Desulfobacteraceae bacterium]|nr:glycosyltransferase [Desulfobacteraceae bacterium]HPQ27453.1 glycosyltransferase [Desulfobacteraceae bacterium]
MKEIIERPDGKLVAANIDEDWGIIGAAHHTLLQRLGLSHLLIQTHLSSNLISWLESYQPELLYIQVSTRETVLFATELINHLKIPAAIHMMDDWPSTISISGFLKDFWRQRIDREFRFLLKKSNTFLSISEAMSAEYLERYNKKFIPFHNPIELPERSQNAIESSEKEDKFRFLYMGRIGNANSHSILSFALSLSTTIVEGKEVFFHIYTPDFESDTSRALTEMRNIKVFRPVKHESVYNLLKEYDVLLLPLDFTESGIKFAKFSIPTKASEYMISGTPVLVFAPGETAVSRFFMANECGYCLTANDDVAIKNTIKTLVQDQAYRVRTGINAIKVASALFDGHKVRQKFQNLLKMTSRASVRDMN